MSKTNPGNMTNSSIKSSKKDIPQAVEKNSHQKLVEKAKYQQKKPF